MDIVLSYTVSPGQPCVVVEGATTTPLPIQTTGGGQNEKSTRFFCLNVGEHIESEW